MSDLADNTADCRPLERVPESEPERTNYALAVAERALRVLGVVMQRAGHDLLFIREAELAAMEPSRVTIGKVKDGMIPVMRDI